MQILGNADEKSLVDSISYKDKPGSLDHAWLIGAMALGTALRFAGIMREPIWYDEWWSLRAVGGTWTNLWRIIWDDSHPPLYYILLKIYLLIFPGALGGRSFSALISLIPIFFVWLCERRLLPKSRWRYATVFCATSPFLIYHGQEIRMYALLAAEASCVLYFSVRYVSPQRGRRSQNNLIAFGLSGGLLSLTHYHGTTIMLATLMFLTAVLWTNGQYTETVRALLTTLQLWAPFLIVQLFFLCHQTSGADELIEWIGPLSFVEMIKMYPMAVYGILRGHEGLKFIVFVVMMIALSWTTQMKSPSLVWLLLICTFLIPNAAMVLFTQTIKPIFVFGRHNIIYLPGVLLATGVSLSAGCSTSTQFRWNPASSRIASHLTAVILFCIMLTSCFLAWLQVTKEPWD